MRGIRLVTADPANPKYKQKDLSSSPPTTGNCKTRNNSSSTYELRDLWITTGPLYPDLPDQESGSIYVETNTPSGAQPKGKIPSIPTQHISEQVPSSTHFQGKCSARMENPPQGGDMSEVRGEGLVGIPPWGEE